MEIITCTRRLEIDAAHRLVSHKGKCAGLHGHRYIIDTTCEAPNLDSGGMVIDFSMVKAVFGTWLDDNFDHTTILNDKDTVLIETINAIHKDAGKKPVYVVDFEPTSENLSWFLLNKANELLMDHCVVVSVLRIYETPNCWSDAQLSRPVVNALQEKALEFRKIQALARQAMGGK